MFAQFFASIVILILEYSFYLLYKKIHVNATVYQTNIRRTDRKPEIVDRFEGTATKKLRNQNMKSNVPKLRHTPLILASGKQEIQTLGLRMLELQIQGLQMLQFMDRGSLALALHVAIGALPVHTERYDIRDVIEWHVQSCGRWRFFLLLGLLSLLQL